jgi:hemerythrin-like domain-containing protein
MIVMADALTAWHAEHERFAKLLDFLAREMAVFASGDEPDYLLMRDVVEYLHHYGDRFHHPREDVAFARLVARDPRLELAVNRLLQEHRVIAAAGEALLECLQGILNDVVIERHAVEAAAATYLLYYRHHLATEESDILPRAAQRLTPDDWAAVASAVPAVPDPLAGENGGAQYRALRAQIDRAG